MKPAGEADGCSNGPVGVEDGQQGAGAADQRPGGLCHESAAVRLRGKLSKTMLFDIRIFRIYFS